MKTIARYLAFFLSFSVISLLPPFIYAGPVEILTYGSPWHTMSGELLLVVEDFINEPNSKLLMVGQNKGLAYRNNSTFLLTQSNYSNENLNLIYQKPLLKKSKFEYFETARSILVLSEKTPEFFKEKLKSIKSKSLQYEGVNRFWGDLQWGSGKSAIIQTDSSDMPVYDFNRKSWNIEKLWDLSFYITYVLSYEGKEFQVTVLPKAFGGIERITSVIKNASKKESIILNTGDLMPVPDDNGKGRDILDQLSKMGPQVVSASYSETINLKNLIEPYQEHWNNKAPLKFISANICKIENEKCNLVFDPYVIIEKSGVKYAIIGITSPLDNAYIEKASSKNPWLQNVKIIDPAPMLKNEILPKVNTLADVVVLLINSTDEEYGKLYSSLNGVDLVFKLSKNKYNWSDDSTLNIKNFKARVPKLPVEEIGTGQLFMSKTQVELKLGDLKITKSNILLDQNINSDNGLASSDSDFKQFANLLIGKDTILPDEKKIYPNKLFITKEEFANLASEVMRRELNAEVGVFNIQEQNSNIIGEQDSSIVKLWIQPDEQIEIDYLTGRELKALISFNTSAESPNKLAIAGVDSKMRIAGLSIRDDELYRVAMSNRISSNKSVFRPLANVQKRIDTFTLSEKGYQEDVNGQIVLMADFLIDNLRKLWNVNKNLPEHEMALNYRKLYEGRSDFESKGYWINEIKNLQIEYSQLTTTDVSAFNSVQDSRLKTMDQRYLSSNLSYLATYRKYPFVNEIGLKAQHTKLELLPRDQAPINNTLSDDILLFANIGFPVYSVNNYPQFATEMGPFIEVAYNTEFEKDAGLDFKKNLLSFYGWKFLNGSFFRSTSISLMHEKRFTTDSERNLLGLNSKIEIQKYLFEGRANYRSDIEYRYFFDDNSDNNSDLRSRFVWDQYFDLKVFGGLTFGPFLKYFSLTRKTVNESTQQVMVGVSLNFSKMWK